MKYWKIYFCGIYRYDSVVLSGFIDKLLLILVNDIFFKMNISHITPVQNFHFGKLPQWQHYRCF